ncbi:MAG: DNA-binding transcriptional regulator [Akkermansiaceae bacterium]|nr:DNA-binding transcriptional regulator [Akkermansiaceae bacterium]
MKLKRKRIALLVETSLGSGREILRGIAEFSRNHDNWEIFHAARGLVDQVPDWLETWEGDGVIARIQSENMLQSLKDLNIPVVDVLGVPPHNLPLIRVDDEQISKQIGQHFIDRDFRHFAFYGIEGESWSQRRGEAFRKVSESGESFAWINSLRGISEGNAAHFSKLKQWLLGLPKPCAVMVCSDQCGLTLLEACRAAEIIVPEQVAVVGVDNDLALCEISTPNLSSVRGGHRRVGFEAANLLNKIIHGEPTPSERILIPPNQIVVRESSDSRSISDPEVRNAIQFIREHLSEPLTNEDVAKAVGLSRTRLQVRFRDEVGMSLHAFLAKMRLRRAERLIQSTNLTFADIAERCGFRHHEYLGYILKKARGITPRQLRMQAVPPAHS